MPDEPAPVQLPKWRRQWLPHPLADDREPWERQPKETRKAFAAFVFYVELTAHRRSYRAVARELAKSYQLIRRWARVWRWEERADAKDADEYRKRAADLRKKRMDDQERRRGLAVTLETKVARRLVGVKEKDSDKWEVPPISEGSWDALDIRHALESSIKLNPPPETEQEQVARAVGLPPPGEHDFTRRILEDPVSTALAAELLERAVQPERAGSNDSGGMGGSG